MRLKSWHFFGSSCILMGQHLGTWRRYVPNELCNVQVGTRPRTKEYLKEHLLRCCESAGLEWCEEMITEQDSRLPGSHGNLPMQIPRSIESSVIFSFHNPRSTGSSGYFSSQEQRSIGSRGKPAGARFKVARLSDLLRFTVLNFGSCGS